jgi:biopolymer transport protein ExbB
MLWEWIVAGGFTMLALILLSVFSLGVVLERLACFRRLRRATATLRGDLQAAIGRNDWQAVVGHCEESESPLAALLLAEYDSGQEADSDKAQRALELTLRGQMARLRRYLPILATIASIAPFVGLFGTCKGIIAAFSDIATQGMGGPSVIAAGIAEALVSTATGLIVAIPALLFYNYFTKAISNDSLELESEAFRLYQDLRHQTAPA